MMTTEEEDKAASLAAMRELGSIPELGNDMPQMQVVDSFSVENEPQEQPSPESIRAQYSPSAQSNPTAPPRAPIPMPQEQGPAMDVQLPAPQQAQQAPPRSGGGDWDFFRAATAFGGGDVGAYDAAQKERRDRPYVDEQRRLKTGDEATARADAETARAAARARLDPNSAESLQAQTDYTASLKRYAMIPGIPKSIADELTAAGANASKMSAAHIDRAFPALKDLLGTALHGADGEGRGH